MISSHGWKALTKAGSTSPTQRQKWLLAGSNNPGPQVVTATTPPGRTRRQISRRNAVISAAKNTPKTQTTASKPPSGSLVRVASPDRELDVGQPFVRRPGPGQLKQRRRYIHAEHTPRGSHGAGSRDRRRPGAAAQVEHHAAGRQPQPRHRRGAEPVPEAQRGLPVVIGRGSVGASRLALDRLDRHIHLCGQPAAPMVSPSPEIDNPSGQPKNVTHRTRLTRRTGSRPFSPNEPAFHPRGNSAPWPGPPNSHTPCTKTLKRAGRGGLPGRPGGSGPRHYLRKGRSPR